MVITIIVLLLLAGISISMLSGQDGILNKASDAKLKTQSKNLKEGVNVAYLTAVTSGNGKVDYGTLNLELEKLGFDRGVAVEGVYPNDIKELPAIVKIEEKDYIIKDNGELISVGEYWIYKRDQNDRKTIITNGIIELKIGDYINYNPLSKNASGTETLTATTITSNAGLPTSKSYYKASNQTLKEGNGYSAQTFSNGATTNGWRVLGVNENTGEIKIISADPVKTAGNGYFYLNGIAGFIYGESELDKVCSIFGTGYGASEITTARSIDVDDINKITGFNPNNIGVYDPEQKTTGTPCSYEKDYQYGNVIQCSWTSTIGEMNFIGSNGTNVKTTSDYYNTYGFNWYDSASKKWKNSIQDIENPEKNFATLKSTTYSYYPTTLNSSSTGTVVGIEKDSVEYATIYKNKAGSEVEFWLATSIISTYSNTPNFGMKVVKKYGQITGYSLYLSTGKSANQYYYIRPVVSLKNNIDLKYNDVDLCYDIQE